MNNYCAASYLRTCKLLLLTGLLILSGGTLGDEYLPEVYVCDKSMVVVGCPTNFFAHYPIMTEVSENSVTSIIDWKNNWSRAPKQIENDLLNLREASVHGSHCWQVHHPLCKKQAHDDIQLSIEVAPEDQILQWFKTENGNNYYYLESKREQSSAANSGCSSNCCCTLMASVAFLSAWVIFINSIATGDTAHSVLSGMIVLPTTLLFAALPFLYWFSSETITAPKPNFFNRPLKSKPKGK